MAKDKPYISGSHLIYSLRTRLMLSSFILILVPLALAGWLIFYLIQDHLREDAAAQLQSNLAAVSLYFNNQVERTHSAVLAAARDNVVKTTLRLGITGQLKKHLAELRRQNGLDFLFIIAPDGHVPLAYLNEEISRASIGAVDFSEHPVFSAVNNRQGVACTVLEESSFLLQLLEIQGKGIDFRPVVLVESAAMIVLRDTFIGTVFGGFMVTDNDDLIDEIESAVGGSHVEFVAADRMVAGTDNIHPLTGERRTFFPVKLDYTQHVFSGVDHPVRSPEDGVMMVFDYLPLSAPGQEPELALVVGRPLSDFLEVLYKIGKVLFLVFTAAVIVALAGAAVMSGSLARPLQDVVASMRRIRSGGQFIPLECQRDDEIGELISGYNEMALALDNRIRELGEEINYREEAEIKLAMESERLRVTLQSLDDAVVATDTAGDVVLMNRVAEQWTGWQREDGAGRPVKELFKMTGSDGTILVDPLQLLHARQTPPHSSVDLQMMDVQGKQRVVTISGSQLINRDGEILGSVLVLRDVTDRRRIDAEIARGQKLESVGVLAGGIAHDFNNLLTAILGNLSLARMVSSPESPHYKNIEDAEKASLRARELTQQLLTFSRGGSPVKGNVDLKELVRDSAEFVVRGANVQLRFAMDEDLWLVTVDRGQIGQVIDNLVINAMQAMPKGGFIDISLSNFLAGESRLLPLKESHYVQLVVQDHGAGIHDEHLGQIFDPYFTTKKEGNGLGLSICFSIIRKHGGYVTVDSKPGEGSRFSVYLPAISGEVFAKKEPESVVVNPRSGGGKRILVMDDDELVCSVVASILEHFGYDADFAADGAEALAMYGRARDQDRKYDLVIMDLTIPAGMGGVEAIKRLLELDPTAQAIVSSGYSSHEVMANYTEYGFVGVVVKPFKIDDLGRILQETLGG